MITVACIEGVQTVLRLWRFAYLCLTTALARTTSRRSLRYEGHVDFCSTFGRF